jgi:hypothetical protein
MSELKIVDTIKRSFNLLKKDPALIVLFIPPAIFSLLYQRITNYLSDLMFLRIMEDIGSDASPLPPMLPVLLLILSFVIGFFFGVWASAAAILKVTELEKGRKLGLREALSRGLRKVPKLLVPAVISLAIFVLTIASLATVYTNYPFLLLGTGPSVIVLRVAVGCLFVIGLYVLIRLYLYSPACVLENTFGLKTSWKLTKGNWWKLLAIFLIFRALSVFIKAAYIVGPFLSGVIVGPFSVAVMTLIYFQLKEGASSREEHKESL